MRHFILILMSVLVLAVSTSFGQTTAVDYYESGIVRYKQKDYDGAIADFTLSIDLDSRYTKPITIAVLSDSTKTTWTVRLPILQR